MARTVAIGVVAIGVSTPIFVSTPSQAEGDTRSLKIYYVHTGEKAVITYKRNGKFDPRGLEQLNRILRDWRKNQPTKMNPRLFDLIWEVYRESGSHEFINVVCGFRSPDTNEMLRTRSAHTGVAKKSQHMLGNAMDFYIPDVKLAKLREIGMKLQVGGVGFYPTSGSPFVHMDVGGVRAWPRMDRQDLVRLFPDGKTMHIPADGRPLPGYEQAVADYKRRMASEDIQVASVSPTKRRGFFAMLFGGGGADEAEDNSDSESTSTSVASSPRQPAAPAAVEQQPKAAPADDEPQTAVASLNAPIPAVRPSFANAPAGSDMASALVSPNRSAAQEALAAAMPADGAQGSSKYADLSSMSVPVPSLLGVRRAPGDAEVMTASADPLSAQQDSMLSAVPVPVERPAVAENLLANANSDADAQEDDADENAALSPSVVAALEQHRADEEVIKALAAAPAPTSAMQAIAAATPQPTAPQVIPSQRPVKQPTKPVQVASIPPISNTRFYDAFDAPNPNDASIVAGVPMKGGRPTKQEASAASAGHAASAEEAALTDKLVTQWALTNVKVENISRPVKAPRFVSAALREQPASVTGGFKQQAAAIDPGRFSGTAVPAAQTTSKFSNMQ